MRDYILEIYQKRFACKGYDKDRKVSQEDFDLIMEVGRLSPSSMGLEPWKFLVIKRKSIKDKLRTCSWGAINSLNGASHFVVILARKPLDTRYDSSYVKYIMEEIQGFPPEAISERRATFKSFQEDDFKLLESDRALFDWACKQTYIPLANMLTTAAMLGIDSTPMEGFHRDKVEKILIDEQVMDSEHYGVSCMIAFGYCNKPPRPKTRRKAEEVIEVIE